MELALADVDQSQPIPVFERLLLGEYHDGVTGAIGPPYHMHSFPR